MTALAVDSVDQSLQQLRKAIHSPLADNRAFIHIIFQARVEQLVTLLFGERTERDYRNPGRGAAMLEARQHLQLAAFGRY